MEFEWDADKNTANQSKHGISFEEAAAVFNDVLSLTKPDPDHSGNEDRFITIGSTGSSIIVVVVHTDRDGRIRIISARRAEPNERRQYEGKQHEKGI